MESEWVYREIDFLFKEGAREARVAPVQPENGKFWIVVDEKYLYEYSQKEYGIWFLSDVKTIKKEVESCR